MYISKKHISRRTILRGMGVTVALPFLDAMVPAASAFAKTEAGQSAAKQRFVAMDMVHGNAGSTANCGRISAGSSHVVARRDRQRIALSDPRRR